MSTKKEIIKYLGDLGIKVNTTTKARGHQGFFLKNRIDISKNIKEERIIPTLIHEFAHYVHYQIEPDMTITGGTLKALFGEDNPIIQKELIKVTNFVDENSLFIKLYEHKNCIKGKIKEYEKIIKKDYPKFIRSKPFKDFDKYIKKSEARYLLKYDRVRVVSGFFKKSYKLLTISCIEKDFPTMPASFAAYIRLHSAQKKQSRISGRINKLSKYYNKPTELFARLVEGLYIDREWVCAIAPYTSKLFFERLKQGLYPKLEYIMYQYL